MPVLRFPVAVVMERVPIASRWASARWQPSAVIALDAESAEGVRRLPTAATAQWRFDGHCVELHRSEGEGYWLNLTSPAPKVFVMWRPAEEGADPEVRPHAVTLSYNEAARMLDAGEQVEGVPLAPELRAWMQPFVDANYTPEPRKKIRRNDPLADDRARIGADPRAPAMSDAGKRDGFTLRRWSQRKLEAARAADATPAVTPAPAQVAAPAAASAPPVAPASTPTVTPELPPLDSLTIDSDFTAFLQPGIDESLRRGALRKLFADPRFNLMDGLDVYIDDYSKPDLLAPEIARTLAHARYIFDPPATRVNPEGFVEDVPPEAAVVSQSDSATPERAESDAPDEQPADEDGAHRTQ